MQKSDSHRRRPEGRELAAPDTRDFEAFRDRGDVEALVRFFDAAAPRLALLAAHLVRHAADAEDLVQATFLRAIERARDFDGRGPAAAWLAQILRRLAVDRARRRGARPRETNSEPEHLAALADPSPAVDPVALATDDEVFERVASAIDGLERPYRQVLALRLLHGLRPIEIARALEREPATVRKQLERGLEHLRAALPDAGALLGVSVLTVVVGEGARGLGAVREVVRAGAVDSLAGAGRFFAASGRRRTRSGGLAVGAIVVSLVSVLAYAFLPQDVRDASIVFPATSDLQLASAPTTGPGKVADVALADADSSPRREIATVRNDPVHVAVGIDSNTATIEGRLLRPDGSPAAHVDLIVDGWRNELGEPLTSHEERSATGEDGTFHIVFAPRPGHQYALEAQAHEAWRARWRWPEIASGSQIDLGTTHLPRLVTLRGSIVDASGAGVSGYDSVTVDSEWRPSGEGGDPSWEYASLDREQGTFVAEACAVGLARVVASTRSRSTTTEATIAVDRDTAVKLVHRGPPPGSRISVRFEIQGYWNAFEPDPARVRLVAPDGTERSSESSGAFGASYWFEEVGTTSYELVVDDPRYVARRVPDVRGGFDRWLRIEGSVALDLDVRDAATGVSVDDYVVEGSCRKVTAGGTQVWSGRMRLLESELRPDGSKRFRTVPEPQVLTITSPGRAPSTIDLTDPPSAGSELPIRVDLGQGLSISGRVVGSNGIGVPSLTVRLREAIPFPARSDPLEVRNAYMNSALRRHYTELATADDGSFRFDRLEPGRYDLAVCVGRQLVASSFGVEPGSDSVVLELPPHGTVRIRVDGTDALGESALEVRIEEPRISDVLDRCGFAEFAAPDRFPVGSDGRIDIPWVPIGTCSLELRLPTERVPVGAGGFQSVLGRLLVGRTVEVDEGDAVEVVFEVDAEDAQPIEVPVHVSATGWPAEGLVVRAFQSKADDLAEDRSLRVATGVVGADGVATVTPLRTGTWDFVVTPRSATWFVEVASDVEVTRGAALSLTADVRVVTGRVEFATEDGEPVTDRIVSLPTYAFSRTAGGTTGRTPDLEGGLEWALVPGTYDVSIESGRAGVPPSHVELVWTEDGPATTRFVVE
ncbi:MAG: RNA polymerase sigma factor [Planctomycetota bacterium]